MACYTVAWSLQYRASPHWHVIIRLSIYRSIQGMSYIRRIVGVGCHRRAKNNCWPLAVFRAYLRNGQPPTIPLNTFAYMLSLHELWSYLKNGIQLCLCSPPPPPPPPPPLLDMPLWPMHGTRSSSIRLSCLSRWNHRADAKLKGHLIKLSDIYELLGPKPPLLPLKKNLAHTWD